MKKRGKVLVVEDNPTWSNRLREALEENGFYVVVKKTKVEALEVLEKKELFHFATVDLQLDENTLDDKKFEGWEVMKKILAIGLNENMPVMVLTGFPGDEESNNQMKALYGGYKATYFMEKAKWDKKKFIDTVIMAVEWMDIQFKDDYKH